MNEKVSEQELEKNENDLPEQENVPVAGEPTEEVAKEVKDTKVEIKQAQGPKEEAPVEIIPLEKDEDVVSLIDQRRSQVLAQYKKSKKISNIMMIVAVVLVMGSILMISLKQYGAGLMIGGYILAGVTLVGLVVFYIINRNKFPDATRKFIDYFFSLTNRYVYGRKGFEGMHYSPKEKFDLSTILQDRAYKDVLQITSRNIVRGRYAGKEITVGELALYNAGQKRGSRNICFLGKYVSYTNDLHFEGRYILSITSNVEKKVDVPTDIEDLVVKTEGKFTAYCPNDKEPSAVLGNKFISALKKVNVTEPMFNLNVVVWAGHTAVYISYDDPIMNVPFEKPYTDEPLKRYTTDLDTVLVALKEIAGK